MKKRRRIKYSRIIMVLILLVGLSTTLISLATSFLAKKSVDEGYDLTKFQEDNGKMIYQDDRYNSSFGIDVSSHQKEIDWVSVADADVEFAFIRCGYRGGVEGFLHEDEYFDQNMSGASNHGIKTGVYFYSSAITMEELEEEADFVLDKVTNHKLDCPIVYDMEIYDLETGRINSLTMEQKTDFALRFCEIMEEHGYQSMIYGNINWLYEQLDYQRIKDHELWYAAYQASPSMEDPFRIWQYSSTGRIPGISTNVDLNLWLTKKE